MQINHILLPLDGSSYSNRAAEYAMYLAKLSGAKITAVICYELPSTMPEISDSVIKELGISIEKKAENVLAVTAKLIKEAGIEHSVQTLSGSPGKILTTLAKTKEYDLIVMGSHGHSDIAGLFLGSVTHKVLNTIYCPVLIVP
jgi:nucleotide-binding universal stress UspA family protein